MVERQARPQLTVKAVSAGLVGPAGHPLTRPERRVVVKDQEKAPVHRQCAIGLLLSGIIRFN